MFKVLKKLNEGFLDVLLPKFCLGCNREGFYICKDCETFLSETAPSKEVMSVWEYEGLMKKLIYHIKYQGQTHIVDELIEKAFQKFTLDLPQNTYITYVPMCRNKEKQRGFNQAELIARKVGQAVKKEVITLLVKTKDTFPQTDLSPAERIKSQKGSFGLREGIVLPDNILLVDDFWATGATMKECFRVLKKSGAKNVWGFTLAKVV